MTERLQQLSDLQRENSAAHWNTVASGWATPSAPERVLKTAQSSDLTGPGDASPTANSPNKAMKLSSRAMPCDSKTAAGPHAKHLQKLQKLRRPLSSLKPSQSHNDPSKPSRICTNNTSLPGKDNRAVSSGSSAQSLHPNPTVPRGGILKRMVKRFREDPPRPRQERYLRVCKEELAWPDDDNLFSFWWLDKQQAVSSPQEDSGPSSPAQSLDALITSAKPALITASSWEHPISDWLSESDHLLEDILQSVKSETLPSIEMDFHSQPTTIEPLTDDWFSDSQGSLSSAPVQDCAQQQSSFSSDHKRRISKDKPARELCEVSNSQLAEEQCLEELLQGASATLLGL